jgi:hypothetical protein
MQFGRRSVTLSFDLARAETIEEYENTQERLDLFPVGEVSAKWV